MVSGEQPTDGLFSLCEGLVQCLKAHLEEFTQMREGLMEMKTWKEFHRDLRWSTRIYTLAVALVILFSVVFHAWTTNWTLTIIASIAGLLFVETFAYYFAHHPKMWRLFRWVLILMILMLIILGVSG